MEDVFTIGTSSIAGGGGIGGKSNLTTVGAVPYVSASGVLNQDGSFLRVVTGQYTLYDPTATTGRTQLIVKEGAGQASAEIFNVQDSAGNNLFGVSQGKAVWVGSSPRALIAIGTGSMSILSGSQYGWSSDASNVQAGANDLGLNRNAAGVLEVNNGTAGTYRDLKHRLRVMTVGADIASATTIAPTESIHMVTGTTVTATITAPTPFAVANGGGTITLIPTGLWTTNTAGNIALATVGVVGKAIIFHYNNTTSKWYPSY